MQNVQDVMPSVRLNGVDKNVEVASSAGEVVKKFRVFPPREECRRPKPTTDRDQSSPLCPNQSDKHFQTSVVADKYLLLEQAEGSSLYRCVDVNTQEELVCKVSKSFDCVNRIGQELDSFVVSVSSLKPGDVITALSPLKHEIQSFPTCPYCRVPPL